MIAVISGATGLVGSLLLSKLLVDPAITQVISITRKPLNLSNLKLTELIVSDFSNLENYTLQLKGDLYFCALGTTIKTAGSKENFKKVDFDAIVSYAKIAEKNKAKSLCVVSANMADSKSSIFYNQVKGQTEDALQKMSFNRLVIFRPGLLVGARAEFRSLEKLSIAIFKTISPLLPSKVEKSIGTDIEVLTDRMLLEAKISTPEVKIINAVEI